MSRQMTMVFCAEPYEVAKGVVILLSTLSTCVACFLLDWVVTQFYR